MSGRTGERAPTMKDVAREAGVALGTVSKVFNRFDTVGEDYRRKVMDAAERLGYQVNSYARGLKTNRTFSVAVILPNILSPFFAVLAQNLCSALTARNYRMILSITGENPEAEQRCIRLAQQNQVDGIIGLTYNPGLSVSGNIPYVSFDRYVNPEVPCVSSDNFGGGRLAAQKLSELGCRRLLFLRTGSPVAGEADKRRDGFESYCRDQALDYDILFRNGDELGPFRDYFSAHMQNGRLDFDGIFCSTDGLAMGIRKILAEFSLRVPEDVQMIGYDGTGVHIGQGLVCSTIVQPIPMLAEKCVDILLTEDKSDLPSLICLPVTYAPGGTTKEAMP